MSASGSGAIGPVSVRYAAQIRELLFAQAMQRMAADQEAARAEAAAQVEPVREPVEAKANVAEPAHAKPASASTEARPAANAETPRLVDIQA
jgi:hypothetical protein